MVAFKCMGAGPSLRPDYLRDNEPDLECPNDGRYVNEHNEIRCGICDAKDDDPSIRLSDLPTLIALLGDIASRVPDNMPALGRDVGDFLLGDLDNPDAHLSRADVGAMLALVQKRGVTFR